MRVPTLRKRITTLLGALLISSASQAVEINWIDWESSVTDSNGFTAMGTITSGSETISVTYNNPLGVGFFQVGVGGEIDYWQNSGGGRNAATSPYTSTGANGVDNIPTGTDIVALRYAGTQTLTFSQAVANLVFGYVSLNGNGYGFDQDFEILSVGGVDGNDCGYWGCGTSYKNIDGSEYQLLGTGEPHGVIRFTGIFNEVSWRSLSNEYWNGFTVGVQGTAEQVFPCEQDPTLPQCNPTNVPTPGTIGLVLLGLSGLGFARRKRA